MRVLIAAHTVGASVISHYGCGVSSILAKLFWKKHWKSFSRLHTQNTVSLFVYRDAWPSNLNIIIFTLLERISPPNKLTFQAIFFNFLSSKKWILSQRMICKWAWSLSRCDLRKRPTQNTATGRNKSTQSFWIQNGVFNSFVLLPDPNEIKDCSLITTQRLLTILADKSSFWHGFSSEF